MQFSNQTLSLLLEIKLLQIIEYVILMFERIRSSLGL